MGMKKWTPLPVIASRVVEVLPATRKLLVLMLDEPAHVIDAVAARLIASGIVGVRVCCVTGREFLCDRRRVPHYEFRRAA